MQILILHEVIKLTTINCTSECVHQKDGKCTLINTTKQTISNNSDCAYFQKKFKNIK